MVEALIAGIIILGLIVIGLVIHVTELETKLECKEKEKAKEPIVACTPQSFLRKMAVENESLRERCHRLNHENFNLTVDKDTLTRKLANLNSAYIKIAEKELLKTNPTAKLEVKTTPPKQESIDDTTVKLLIETAQEAAVQISDLKLKNAKLEKANANLKKSRG